MPYTAAGKNLMLDALCKGTSPSVSVTHAALFKKESGKSVTAAASTDICTSTSHGYSNGDVVVFSALTGGSGVTAGNIYYVTNSATNTFQVAQTAAGSAVDITSDMSAGTVARLAELSGGSPAYARKAIAFAVAALGISDDSTNGAVFDVAASSQVDYVAFFSASTSGTGLGFAPVTQEVFGSQGTYTLTDAKLDLNS